MTDVCPVNSTIVEVEDERSFDSVRHSIHEDDGSALRHQTIRISILVDSN